MSEPNKNNGKNQNGGSPGGPGKSPDKKPDIRQVLADTVGDFLRLSGILQRLDTYMPKHIEEHKATYEKVRVAVNGQAKIVKDVEKTVADLELKINNLDATVNSIHSRHSQSIAQHDQTFQQQLQQWSAENKANDRFVITLCRVILGLLLFIIVVVSGFEYYRFTEVKRLHERIDRLAEYQKSAAQNSSPTTDEKQYAPGAMKARPDQRKSAKSQGQ